MPREHSINGYASSLLQSYGMTLRQASVYLALQHGAKSVVALSQQLHTPLSTIYRALKDLRLNGLLSNGTDPTDSVQALSIETLSQRAHRQMEIESYFRSESMKSAFRQNGHSSEPFNGRGSDASMSVSNGADGRAMYESVQYALERFSQKSMLIFAQYRSAVRRNRDQIFELVRNVVAQPEEHFHVLGTCDLIGIRFLADLLPVAVERGFLVDVRFTLPQMLGGVVVGQSWAGLSILNTGSFANPGRLFVTTKNPRTVGLLRSHFESEWSRAVRFEVALSNLPKSTSRDRLIELYSLWPRFQSQQ